MDEREYRESKIDRFSTRLTNRLKFFKKGFGDREFLSQIPELLSKKDIVVPEINWKNQKKFRKILWKKGEFLSPFSDNLPEEARLARVGMVSPMDINKDTPILIHFAMTGDQGYMKRLIALGLPLVKDGIASVILEIPYYGSRKPRSQFHIFVNTVSDFFRMCGGTILEGLGLISYFKKEGFRNLGVTGVSMGGNITCFVASLSTEVMACIPCLPPPSPGPVFVDGMLGGSVHWEKLAAEEGGIENAKLKLRNLMESTSLLGFPITKSAGNTIFVAGDADGIVRPETVVQLHEYWKGSELRWVSGGHIRSIFGKTGAFREAIRDSFQKLVEGRKESGEP